MGANVENTWLDGLWVYCWHMRMVWDLGVPVWHLPSATKAYRKILHEHVIDPEDESPRALDVEAYRREIDAFLERYSPLWRKHRTRAGM
jgi:hypothetical protein